MLVCNSIGNLELDEKAPVILPAVTSTVLNLGVLIVCFSFDVLEEVVCVCFEVGLTFAHVKTLLVFVQRYFVPDIFSVALSLEQEPPGFALA